MKALAATICSSFVVFSLASAQTPAPPQPPLVVVQPEQTARPIAKLPFPLVFDADTKDYSAKPGELSAPFVFKFTNTSSSEVIINSVNTSCGCTVAKLPSQPWHLPPGTNGEINVTMNLAGKMGRVTKQATVNTSAGNKALIVNVTITQTHGLAAENARGDRNKNIELAKADRQIVFKGDCRSCHVDPGVGKAGKELYDASCGICHDSPIRAAMVPDLRAPKGPRDRDYWLNWITYGRPGSMMPAFGEKDGGPLSKEQIESLVGYLNDHFPKGTPAATPVAVPIQPSAPKVGGTQ